MLNYYIFTNISASGEYLNIALNAQNEIEYALAYRPISAFDQEKEKARFILVLPGQAFSFFAVTLPRLNEKKIRAALPFALEDKVAEELDMLHFAFSPQFYQQGKYLAAVCSKSFLKNFIDIFTAHHIPLHGITCEWFAVNAGETFILDQGLLIHEKEGFKGYLDATLAALYLQKITDNKIAENTIHGDIQDQNHKIFSFSDSSTTLLPSMTQAIASPALSFIAKRLNQQKYINLCQGEFSLQQSAHDFFWYGAVAGMAILSLMSWIIGNGLALHHLNKEIQKNDIQIAQIYHQFFPNTKQVISPQFRITQLLKTAESDTNRRFWNLLFYIAQASIAEGGVVKQLRFQGSTLHISLIMKNFAALEKLQTALLKNPIKVKQTEAVSQNNQVLVGLELSPR